MSKPSAQSASPPWDDASITAIRRDMLRFARMQLRDEAADIVVLELVEGGGAGQVQQRGEVVAVAFEGQPADAALVGQLVEPGRRCGLRCLACQPGHRYSRVLSSAAPARSPMWPR